MIIRHFRWLGEGCFLPVYLPVSFLRCALVGAGGAASSANSTRGGERLSTRGYPAYLTRPAGRTLAIQRFREQLPR